MNTIGYPVLTIFFIIGLTARKFYDIKKEEHCYRWLEESCHE